MGIDPYLVASTINLAIGQRLVRMICTECKETVRASEAMVEALPDFGLVEGETLYRGKGCDACNSSGYKGRISINEVLVADQIIKEAIMRKASVSELRRLAVDAGMTTMLEDGFKKVREGKTTVEEVLRVIHE